MQQIMDFGFVQLRSYTFFINLGSVLGSILALLLCYFECKKVVLSFKIFFNMLIIVVCGAVAGNFLRGLTYGEVNGVADFIRLFTEWQGSHFIGRVLFVILLFPKTFSLLFRKKALDLNRYMDIVCIFLGFQHIFNRIACLFNGCCFGKYYDGVFALQYEGVSGIGPAVSYPVYPTQLFEIIAMVVLCTAMFILYSRKKSVTPFFEIGFGLAIFLSEFMMNVDGTIQILGLTVVQYAAILLIGLGIRKLFVLRR